MISYAKSVTAHLDLVMLKWHSLLYVNIWLSTRLVSYLIQCTGNWSRAYFPRLLKLSQQKKIIKITNNCTRKLFYIYQIES